MAQGIGGLIGIGAGDPSNPNRYALGTTGTQASDFASGNDAAYWQSQAGINNTIAGLQAQTQGKNSVSAEQLRQGLQQQLAQQQSMAAGAAPQNAAMAARNAAMNMGRASYGMAGQQAVAGLAERNQAQQALGQLQLGQSAQQMQGTLGGYQTSIGANSAVLGNPENTWAKPVMGIGNAGAQYLSKSDRRAKRDIRSGDSDAKKAIEGLKAYSYRYKDERDGKGKQFGPMAQDLERAGLKHTVINTPQGKMVHGAKAATTALGLVASLGKRVAKLEGSKK